MNRWQLCTAVHSAFVRGDISSYAYAKLTKMSANSVDLEAAYDTLLNEIQDYRKYKEGQRG
jgi:hypothetical protein